MRADYISVPPLLNQLTDDLEHQLSHQFPIMSDLYSAIAISQKSPRAKISSFCLVNFPLPRFADFSLRLQVRSVVLLSGNFLQHKSLQIISSVSCNS